MRAERDQVLTGCVGDGATASVLGTHEASQRLSLSFYDASA